MRRPGLGVLGCLVGIGLVVSGVTPVWAAESGPADGSALVGGFGLGDGLEGSIDEPSGAFKLALPAGGLNLGWDSRALGANLFGLGEGWSFGLARIQVDGGVMVFPASGGSYPADTSTDSGLGGYTLADTRFEQTPGVLPAEGGRPEVAYAFSLHELGGSSTYFNDAGDPVAHRTSAGGRTSWVWEPGHRLVEVVDVDGVATSLTWSSSTLVVRPGSNVAGGGEAWVVELQNDRVVAAVDPEGGRTQVVSDPSGLVVEVTGESGARTAVEWRAHDDGVARVERVATFGGDGAELSSRTWQPAGAGVLSSGWPAVDAGVSAQGVAFSSVVGDGQSELVSSYNALGSLVSRVMSGSTSSGRQVLQEQSYRYPGTDEHGVPTVPVAELPKAWANPSEATVTFRDARGGERSGSQRSEFDEFGRLVDAVRGNGVTTTYEYDAVNAITRETTTTNGVVTSDRSYTYDTTGRLTHRTDRITDDQAGADAALTATTTAYTYDSFDRLTSSSVHDGDTTAAPVTRTTQYVNTVAGDVERETTTEHPGTPDQSSTVRVFEYDPAGALTAVTTTTPDGSTRAIQEYDQNGNLTRDLDGTTYTYDADNRVTGHTTTTGVTTTIGYWVDGTRRQLTTDRAGEQVTTGYYWAGDTLLNDTHTGRGEGAITASYLIGTSRHARTLTSAPANTGQALGTTETSYLGTDRHGNTTDLTDQHGTITTRYAYTDYGTTTTIPAAAASQPAATDAAASAARNPFQYAAAYADPAGTLHLDVRDYRPATMRFDTPDTAKELTNYAYGDLNPITKADPSGRNAIGDQVLNGALAIFGLVAGIAAGVALGLPTGGMSWAATAWYVTAAVAIAGDFVSTGIAVAQIIDTAGPRFIRDQDRESLRISGIVIGAVAGFVSGAATYMYRARRAADAAGPVVAAEPPAGPTNSFSHHKSVKGTIKDLQERIRKNLDVIEFDARSARYVTTGTYTKSYNAFNNFMVSLVRKQKPGIETLPKSRWFNGAALLKREKLKSTADWLAHWDGMLYNYHNDMIVALKVFDKRSALLSGGNHALPIEQIPGSINREAGDALWTASNAMRKDLTEAIGYIEVLRANRAERDLLQSDIALREARIGELK